jgi:uncharacterized protein (DUF885 family)
MRIVVDTGIHKRKDKQVEKFVYFEHKLGIYQPELSESL